MKIKNLSKILYTVAFSAAVLSFNSCGEDWLDLKPEGRPTVGEVPLGGFEAKAFGLYSSLRTQGGVSDFSYVWTHCIRADDNEKGSTTNDGATDGNVFNNFAYVATNGNITSDWNGHYKIIYDANELINTAEASGDTSSGTLVNIAEAKAIRAFCYFELRRDFGEIPVILKTIATPVDEIAPKKTIAEVDAQIKKDLEEAANVLPNQWPSVYLGRATKGLANSLLSKLYLYQGNYAKALEYAELVINSGIYQLNSYYDAEFTKAGNNSKESILEVQKTYDFPTKYTNNFYESQGVRGSGVWDLGWGFNVPSTELVSIYENGDLRKKTTILTSGGPDIYNTPNLTLPSSPPLAQQYWNGKAYTLPSERTFYAQNKNHWENIKLIRYADIILIAAEAALQSGNAGKATTYLNMIRSRAGLSNITATLAAIKHERRVEFAMEFERFYDLVRWGDAINVLSSKGYQDKNKYFPIPQTAIDKAQGVLVQNPNY
ncbi:RagB/SusD family nutrient uptake outer membrane protein [Chryseobacterium taihuense]|uniref:Starch-binding associating with outer membrane n=1 Tax=Chryseobacterium taihuense TaxID=1141221 RepID=A0ABY0QVL8_9FLAO|nr:RagB/SusD family nutrient uptake outer membrane protein [Chryseobacterium taihuense]SDL98258.1 Starch-binding associating with outer membrane [Chryseobacterium taihuense]